MKPQVCITHHPMDLPRHVSSPSNMHSNEPSTVVPICSFPTSTPHYTHQHQTSIPSKAIVPALTQNNHSGQDLQQWPISHTSPWADWHMLWRCQITGQQMQQDTCTTVCWPTSCNVWHPQKDLGSCYYTCPTMEQLSSMHQQWFHIPLHVKTPLWMQYQSSQHCP